MKIVTLQMELEIEVDYNRTNTIAQLLEQIKKELSENPGCVRPFTSKNIVKIETVVSKSLGR